MRGLVVLLVVTLLGCSGKPPVPVARNFVDVDVPGEAEQLLVAAESESCAVCIRDKHREAVAAARMLGIHRSTLRSKMSHPEEK